MVTLHTDLPQFYNDIGDILRIFYPMQDLVENGDVFPGVEHRYFADTLRHEAIFYPEAGRRFAYSLEEPVASGGMLEQKRQRKRYAKVSIFRCMQQYFQKDLPWGSLTGVRPTKLARELETQAGEAGARELFSGLFDVSADRIALLFEIIGRQRPILSGLKDDSLDIYIGIPFCPTRCLYCSFTSFPVGAKRAEVGPYLDTLFYEIEASSRIIREEGYRPRCVYIGGGTPTTLTNDELQALLGKTAEAFFPLSMGEFTVEAGRPDTLDKEKLRVLKQAGVNRISINPQTMNDETLRRIGRMHGSAQIIEAFAAAREAGFAHINMDMILGLPGETETDTERALSALEDLSPDSITVHTLAVKRASRLKQQEEIIFSPPDVMREMLAQSRKRTAALGMRPYYMYRQKNMMGHLENTGYCRPHKECVYNVDIMEEAANVLALGAGGISKRVFGGENRIERQANPKDLFYYSQRIGECLQKKRELLRR
jgi:coproporphyrinogen dehydrogenase HemZ